MKKNKTKVVLMVVLAMLLQIIGPAVQSVYAEIANEPFSMTERPIGEDGIAQLDWEFTLDPNDRVEEYTYTGNFTLEKEVPETDLMAGNEEKTVIGNYKISTDGEITVKINQELYDNLEDKEEETPTDPEKATETTEETETTDDTEATDTLPEEGLQEETVEGEGAETEDSEEDQHLQEGENHEGNEGESDGPEEGNDDEVTGEVLEEPTGTEANDENNEQADPENDDEVNEEEQEVSMLGKVVATLATAGEDILLTDDIDQEEEVTEEAKEVKFFTGTIKADGAKEKEDLFGRFVGLFSGPEELKNIFTSVKLLINGNEVGDDDGIVNLDEITESMTIGLEFGWELPDNGSEFQLEKGDWASIQLPSVFKGVTGYMNGPLVDDSRIVGTYHISEEGMLKVIFGDHVEFDDGFLTETGRKGTVGFILDFVLDPFEDNSIQEIEFGDPINKTFIIKVKPDGTLASISKSGEPNKISNADAIDWVIDVNTSLKSLTNAMVKDSIPEGLELEGDIEIYHLKVGIDGSLNQGALKEKTTSTDARNLEVTLGKIDTAYRIKYSTKITDYSKSGYTNIAELFDGEEKKGETSVTVNKVEQGAAISKRSLTPDRNATTIKWEIDVNKGEEVLKNVIVEDVLQENLTVNAGSIKIYELNKGESGWSKGADVTASFTTTSFPLSLGNLETADVYCIEFETDIEYMDYKETNTFQNKAILKAEKEVNGSPVLEQIGESTASATVYRDPIIIKEGKEITSYDSEYPVVEWTIKINGANHHIYDAVLTDTIGSGLRLIAGSIEIDPNSFQGEYPIYSYPTEENNVMKIELGDITSSYTIKYKTEIRSTNPDTFKNKAELTGKGKHGVGVGEGGELIVYPVEKDVTVPPSIVNNNYGKKAVSIDYSNKTMTWQIEIDAVKEALTELTITDTFEDKYMVFIEEGFSVTKGGTGLNPTTDYTLINNNVDGFELIFKETALGKGKYVITYKTSFNPNMIIENQGTPKTGGDNIYKNKVNLSGKTEDAVTKEGKNLNVNLTDAHILNQDIYNVGKKEGTLDREKKEITWRIYVNAQSRNLKGKDFVITDAIGEGHTFKAGSLSVHEFTLKPGGELSEEGINLGVKVTSGYELDADSNPFILKFSGGIDEAYLIEYTTEIEGITKPNYTNEAKITDNTGIEKTYPASVYYKDHNVFITKEALNAKGGRVFADDELNWKVVVNESLSEINNAVFSDTISAGHVYVDGSLKVYKGAIDADNLLQKDTFANADTNKYKLDVTSNSDETTTIKVGLGDINGRYIITYNTAVISSSGVITNTAKLTGTEIGDKSTGIKKFNITTTSWGTGSGTNSELRGAIEIKKVDNAPDRKPVVGAEFKLSYKVNDTWYEVKDKDKDEEYAKFLTDENGDILIEGLPNGRTYKLVEVKAPEGYKLSGTEEDRTRIITVVAKETTKDENPIVNEKIRDITVKKVWIGPGKDGNGAGTATFKLLANGVEKKTITLTTETGWTHTFEGLDYYDSSGESIEYTVTEDSISGYQLLGGNPVKVVDPTLGNITYTFNNKNLEKVKVEVEKIWRKDESKPLPSSVTIKLLRDGIDTETTISLTASEWKGEFTGLDKYDDEGRAYDYTIQEEPVSGFKTEIGSRQTISGGFKYIVTNIELMDIEVEKKWIGVPTIGTEVEVELFKVVEGSNVSTGKTIKIEESGGTWIGKFENMPKYETNGTKIVYAIEEKAISGFRQYGEIEERKVDGFTDKFTITNMELVNIEVIKKWIGPGPGTGAEKGIKIQLLADGAVKDTKELKGRTTPGMHTEETISFTGLDKYTVDGAGNSTLINYTVTEGLNGLESKYAKPTITSETDPKDTSTTIYTITNRNIEKVEIPVTKIWRTLKSTDDLSVEIKLKRGNEIAPIATATLNKDNGWKHTFRTEGDFELFKYDQATGNLITYSIEEEDIDGYESLISPEQSTSTNYNFTITNIELMKIPVTKEWIGTPNVDEVKVTLHKNNIDAPVVSTLKIEKSKGWEGEFTNIPKYEADEADGALTPIAYVIKEESVEGFRTVSIEGTGNETGLTITNMELINIKVIKKWIGPGPGASADASIKINLLADGAVKETVELKGITTPGMHTEDTISFNGLDKYTADKKLIDYTVEEDLNGLESKYAVSTTSVTDPGDPSTTIYTITNKNIEKVKIPVEKVWRIANPIGREATIILYRDGKDGNLEITRAMLTGNITHTFESNETLKLFKYDQTTGNLIDYSVDEEPITGFKKEIGDREATSEGYKFKVTNIELTDIEVKKEWLGDYENTYRVEVTLYENGSSTSKKIELNGSNSWMAKFEDIPKYKADSNDPIVYTIVETPISDYETTIIGDVKDGFTVTNRKLISITGNKVWVNGPATKPTIELQLYKNGTKEGTSVELTNGTSHTWTDLYQTDEYGNVYTYTVDEVDVPANYNKTISGDMDSGFTITNTYESPKKDITATKEWIDGSSIRPDIWFKLYRKISTDSDYSEVEEAKIIKLSSGTLTATWVAQEENDRHGNLYTYLVKEVNESGNPSWKPDNYIKTENLLEVTNRYNSPTDASLKAIKAWDGGPLAKPTIWFKLYRTNDINTAPVEVSTSEVSDVIKELSDGITEVSWTGLTKTDEAGTEYIYSVKEVDKDGNPFVPENYKVSYKHNDTKTEQTVTNTYESPKIQITVEKVWENGSKPEVDIELYRDGIYQESIKLNGTESTPWTHIWEDLDKTDKDGKDYVYTVKEIPVANYTTRIDDSIPNKFIINNTYVIPKVNITGTKKWVGGSTNKPSVELQLYRDGVKYGEPVKLDGKEGTPWIHTWEDLDKTDIDGKEYKYTVDEVKVPNDYYKSISSDGLTVTNTYDPPYYPPEEPGPDPRPTNPPKEPEKPTEPEKETPETPEEPTEPTDPTDPEEPTNPPTDIEETTPKDTPKEGEVDVPEGSKPKVNNPPENGTVTIDKDGKWVYTPNPGFEGKDKFSIIITKPDGTEEEIFFEIDVQTPLGGVEGEEKEKEEKETPILPKTGQVDSILIYLAGLFFIVLGIVLRKRIV